MTYQQSQIDFTEVLHSRENNNFSQGILEANTEHLGGQCKKVLDLLNSGVKLTVRSAMIDYNISSLPRRIKDITDRLGIEIKRNLINGKYVEYFISEAQESDME